MINLSDRPLTLHESSVLSKGLSFVPSKKVESFTTLVEMFKFLRNVKLRAFFNREAPTQHTQRQQIAINTSDDLSASAGGEQFRPKSTFLPPVLNPSVATFCRLVEN